MEDSDCILILFLGTGADHLDRKLSQIAQKSDRWLEETHDYIQWLFPLYAGSQFNPHAPVLTDDMRGAFTDASHSDHAVVQRNFGSAIYRMLVFYGYSVTPVAPDDVSATGEWSEKADNWLTKGNHNFMRLTRILRSMVLLGREPLARSFHCCLIAAARAHPKIISQRKADFWKEAVETKAGATII